MRNLVRFFSYRSFIIGALVVGLILAGLLARDGLTSQEIGLLLGYTLVCVALRFGLRTPPARRAEFDALAAFDGVLAGGRPSLLEFYSDNCAACMLMRPVIDNVEHTSAHRLQTLRVDVNSEIGKSLADRYAVNFTPTFLLFDRNGVKQEEFVFVLDRGRVLYWLNQQTPAA